MFAFTKYWFFSFIIFIRKPICNPASFIRNIVFGFSSKIFCCLYTIRCHITNFASSWLSTFINSRIFYPITNSINTIGNCLCNRTCYIACFFSSSSSIVRHCSSSRRCRCNNRTYSTFYRLHNRFLNIIHLRNYFLKWFFSYFFIIRISFFSKSF